MALVRAGRFPSRSGRKARPVAMAAAASRTKRLPPERRRDWDGTIHDLSVHRATPEQLVLRHEMHKSKNKPLVLLELQGKPKNKWKQQRPRTPESLERRKLALMREILSDQYQLQDVLERSDQAMAVVKDLFGDDPRRHLGFPNVTVAPDCDMDSSQGPIIQKCDPPTQLSLLSESVMDPQALNEVDEESISLYQTDSKNDASVSLNFRSSDTNRMPYLLNEEDSRTSCQQEAVNMLATPGSASQSLGCTALNATNVVKRAHSRLQKEEQPPGVTDLVQQVLNANLRKQKHLSVKVKKRPTAKTPARQKASSVSPSAATFDLPKGKQSSLEVLNQMMHDVQCAMEDYERWTGHEVQQGRPNSQGLSGFTHSLVNALYRVMRYLKEGEVRLRQEMVNRQHVEEELREHRALIDALTAEILLLREETTETQTKLQQCVVVTDDRAMKGFPASSSNRTKNPGETATLSVKTAEAAQDQSLFSCVRQKMDLFSDDQMVALLPHGDLPGQGSNSDGASCSVSGHGFQPAVLLSPPQQKSSQAGPLLQQETIGRESAREQISSTSLQPPMVKEDHSLFNQRGKVSAATKPLPSPLQSKDQPVTAAFSLGAQHGPGDYVESANPGATAVFTPNNDLQVQIAELTFQNSIIKAQLSKMMNCCQEAGSVSNQPFTMQTGPVVKREEASQGMSNVKESPKSLDERIAELSRQSTEARGKLLQLISPQKFVSFHSVSPPISPISAPSRNLPENGRTATEVSTLVAETALGGASGEVSSTAGGTVAKRSSVGSSQAWLPLRATLGNAEPTPESRQTKAGKQREEGWFALSMHVR